MKFSQIFLGIYAFGFSVLSGMPEYTYIEDIFGATLVLVFFLEQITLKGFKISWHWSFNLLVGLYSVALISVLYQPQAFRRFITFTLVLILFYVVFAIIRSSRNINGLIVGLSLGFLSVLIFNYDLIASIAEGFSRDRFAGYMNANNYSFLLAITIAFLLKPLFEKKNIKSLSLPAVLLFFVFSYLILIVIGSRRGIITLFVIFLWSYFYLAAGQKIRYKMLLGSVFLVGGALMISWLYESIFFYRIENLIMIILGEQVLDNSISLRSDMIWTGLEMWKQKPILGWGFDAFRYETGFNTYAHNNYIELLVNHGLIGFLLYYNFVGLILYTAYQKFKVSKTREKGLLSWAMMLIIVLLIGDLAVVSLPQKTNWIVLGVTLATILNVNSKFK